MRVLVKQLNQWCSNLLALHNKIHTTFVFLRGSLVVTRWSLNFKPALLCSIALHVTVCVTIQIGT